MKLYRSIAYFLILLSFTTIIAQDATCGAVVQQALDAVGQSCAATGRNQACYGYVALDATPRTGVENFNFKQVGDLVSVADMDTLHLSRFDPAAKTWGIALMKLQANLPDSLPGQNVAFLVFGEVQIQNASAPTAGDTTQPQYTPMQAFYFKTGITQTGCEQAPEDGILMQTPKGAGQIDLRANEVDIQLGSTAYLQAQPDGVMTVSVVEGDVHVTADGQTVDVPAGTQTTIPMDANLHAAGAPTAAQAYAAALVAALPVRVLPIPITIAAPAAEATPEATATAEVGGGSSAYSAQKIMNLGGESISGSVCALDQPFVISMNTPRINFDITFTPADATQGSYAYGYSFPSAGETDTGSGSYTISDAAADGSRTLTFDGKHVAKFNGGGTSIDMHYSIGLTPTSSCGG